MRRLGDVHAALHFEDLAERAFVIAMLSCFGWIMVALRDRMGERFLIALGASAALAMALWASLLFWP